MAQRIKRSICIASITLTLAILVAALAMHRNQVSLQVHCGLLSKGDLFFLDGSGHTFQKCTWHTGNGRRTWGETFGLKVKRAYASAQVTHTNPAVSKPEADEE